MIHNLFAECANNLKSHYIDVHCLSVMKFTDEVYKTVPRENGEVILFEMDHGLSGWPLNWSLKAV